MWIEVQPRGRDVNAWTSHYVLVACEWAWGKRAQERQRMEEQFASTEVLSMGQQGRGRWLKEVGPSLWTVPYLVRIGTQARQFWSVS